MCVCVCVCVGGGGGGGGGGEGNPSVPPPPTVSKTDFVAWMRVKNYHRRSEKSHFPLTILKTYCTCTDCYCS